MVQGRLAKKTKPLFYMEIYHENYEMNATHLQRCFNFSPGPATLPEAVLHRIQADFPVWQGQGASVMEVSHRSTAFMALAAKVEADCRRLLVIPEHYAVLFMPGGARGQFDAVPMNLLPATPNAVANYFAVGVWSQVAIEAARRHAQVHIVASGEDSDYSEIPDPASWSFAEQGGYCFFVDNETIDGVAFQTPPSVPEDMPLVTDMSSSLFSKPIDIERYGVIVACAQKNLGISGITLAIVRQDLLDKARPYTPDVLNYTKMAAQQSMLNTPPTFPWYVTGLVFEWLLAEGGLARIAEHNQAKAAQLYAVLDDLDFYRCPVQPAHRSLMNVVFYCPSPELDAQLVAFAAERGCLNIKGHARKGGLRLSLYNAMPKAGVATMVEVLRTFAQQYG